MQLRWIIREVPAGEGLVQTVKVLLQHVQKTFLSNSDLTSYKWEWQDVPTVKEEV